MGKVIGSERWPCPDASCGSSDGVRLFNDGTYYCFPCKTRFETLGAQPPPPATALAQPVSQTKSRLARYSEIAELPIRGFKERQITKDITAYYKVKVSYDDRGKIATHYYPYDGGKRYKVRELPKSFTWIAPGADKGSKSLFGVELFSNGGKRVIITEGELDALAVAQASYDRYHVFYPVLSVASSSNLQGLITHREWLRTFNEIIISFDMDKAGEEAAEAAVNIIGIDRARIARLPQNDASATYIESGGEVLIKCMLNAGAYLPLGLVMRDELWARLTAAGVAPGIDYPPCLAGVASKLQKIREGEIALLVSGTGCHAPGTKILMFNGKTKLVEDIRIDDEVMGEDGLAARVLELHSGREAMARITLADSTSFTVNKSHTQTCVSSSDMLGFPLGATVDIKIRQILQLTKSIRSKLRLFRSGPLKFTKKSLPIHPYVLGVWLGSNNSRAVSFPKVRGFGFIKGAFEREGYFLCDSELTDKEWSVDASLESALVTLGLWGNPHVPPKYKITNIKDRQRLLAGLIDAGGRYSHTHKRYEFPLADPQLQDDIVFVCRSLGYEATVLNDVVRFRGPRFHELPVALRYKVADKYDPGAGNRDWLTFDITLLPPGDFYGFTLDNDGRFLLGDFLVTHNSGKSTVLREIMLHVLETTDASIGVVELEASPHETARQLAYMQLRHNPVVKMFPLEQLKPGFDKVFGDDRVTILDHQESLEKSIADKLEYMALMGCKYLFIDHITLLVSEGVDNLTGNEAQDKLMNDLRRLVKKYPIWIGLISQLRKTSGDKGKSFEEGRMPCLDDIKGSGSVKQVPFDIVAFARNMSSPDANIRNKMKISVLKARIKGLTGPVDGATYDFVTGRLVASGAPPPEQELKDCGAMKVIGSGRLTNEEKKEIE